MQKELSELIDVRSIVTLALTLVFCEPTVTGTVTAGQYLSVFTAVITAHSTKNAAAAGQTEKTAMSCRIELPECKAEKHNSVIERMYRLEGRSEQQALRSGKGG